MKLTGSLLALAGLGLAGTHLQAQTAPSFEAASIKPSEPGARPHFNMENGRLDADGFTLQGYIGSAWHLILSREQENAMVAHLPKWVSTDTFKIQARAEDNPTQDRMRLMLQSLLADRFKLEVHFETAQVPVLALVLDKPGKTGPKLRPHSEGPPCDPPNAKVFPPVCGQLSASDRPNHAVLMGERNITMEQLAASVSSLSRLGRPVVDQTGLTGSFDFTLEFTPRPKGPPPPDQDVQPDLPGTTLQEALQDQLGLKLKATTAPLDNLVIDHAERPSEN
jgi:uncharacterized protein (TIGR03435 family)